MKSAATECAVSRAVETIVNTCSKINNKNNNKILILTGAGISVPYPTNHADYRSEKTGLYNRGHVPITYQQFVSTKAQQQRYFARSFFGYPKMREAVPNACHYALADLLAAPSSSSSSSSARPRHRYVSHVVTQNVDGCISSSIFTQQPTIENPNPPRLNKSDERANDVLTELHGTIHRVRCLDCGNKSSRQDLQEEMERENELWFEELRQLFGIKDKSEFHDDEFTEKVKKAIRGGVADTSNTSSSSTPENFRPDGDFFLTKEQIDGFKLPVCKLCGGRLAPDVVLFGDNIPAEVKTKAHQIADDSCLLLCAGTSLQVPSAYRFVRDALRCNKNVLIFNDGPTRIDEELQKNDKKFDPSLVMNVPGRIEFTLTKLCLSLPSS